MLEVRRTSILLILILFGAGCRSEDDFREEADREAYYLVAGARTVADQEPDPDFTIDPNEDRLRDRMLLARSEEEPPTPEERLALKGESVTIDLGTALAIAARNSREYQTEKELLYQSALAFTGALNQFESQFFGTRDFSIVTIGDGGSDTTPSIGSDGSLGFTRMLESGGALSLSVGDSFTRFLHNPATTVATALVNFAITLPLLRGAGKDIAYESATQAERNVIYGVRRFERFKRVFADDIVSGYLQLLQNRNVVSNEVQNYERRKITAVENRALGEAGRIAATDVERANNAELTAENRLIIAQASFETALDGYKLDLGLPTDASVGIDIDDLDRLTERGVPELDIAEEDALVLAMRNRLDLATAEGRVYDARRRIKVAANALLAGLDLSADVDLGTDNFAENDFSIDLLGDANYGVGLLLDLPLERTVARNTYRNAIIAHQSALRAYEATEDQVKFEVRRALRSAFRTSESYRIQLDAERVATTNVEAASLLKDAGEGTTLDLLDAQNDLIAAQNGVTRALIDFQIACIDFYRDAGVLVVGPEGIDYEKTFRLAAGE